MINYRILFLAIIFLSAAQVRGQKIDALITKATNACYANKLDSAEFYFEAAAKLEKKSKPLFSARVNCYLSSQQYNKALAYADSLIAIDSSDATSYYQRGMIHDRISRRDSASLHDYLIALRLKPDYFNAIYNAGAWYYSRNIDIKREAKVCPQPLTVSEERKALMEKAIVYLERALEIKPKDTIVSNALLAMYKELGLQEKLTDLKAKVNKP